MRSLRPIQGLLQMITTWQKETETTTTITEWDRGFQKFSKDDEHAIEVDRLTLRAVRRTLRAASCRMCSNPSAERTGNLSSLSYSALIWLAAASRLRRRPAASVCSDSCTSFGTRRTNCGCNRRGRSAGKSKEHISKTVHISSIRLFKCCWSQFLYCRAKIVLDS